MHKPTMFLTFAAASLALSTSAVLVAQEPASQPASENAATPADPATPATPADPQADTAATPATPATPAAKDDPLAPEAMATTDTSVSKDKTAKKKAAKKPR